MRISFWVAVLVLAVVTCGCGSGSVVSEPAPSPVVQQPSVPVAFVDSSALPALTKAMDDLNSRVADLDKVVRAAQRDNADRAGVTLSVVLAQAERVAALEVGLARLRRSVYVGIFVAALLSLLHGAIIYSLILHVRSVRITPAAPNRPDPAERKDVPWLQQGPLILAKKRQDEVPPPAPVVMEEAIGGWTDEFGGADNKQGSGQAPGREGVERAVCHGVEEGVGPRGAGCLGAVGDAGGGSEDGGGDPGGGENGGYLPTP